MIRNLEGKTALDYALQMEPLANVGHREQVNCFDPILAEEILRGISQYTLFTVSGVCTAIPRAVEFGLEYLPEFLDLRMKTNKSFKSKTWNKNYFLKDKESLLFNQTDEDSHISESTYVTSNVFSAWPNRQKVAESLFL